jgi:hypothetical protein
MKTWKLARIEDTCGSCRAKIRVGEKWLQVTTGPSRFVRCEPCGVAMFGEQPPETIADDIELDDVPSGIPHQPSFFAPRGGR